MKLSSFISRGRTDGLSYSTPFSTWVSIEIPARPVPPALCQRAESLQNTWIQPLCPTDARRALERTLHPFPPQLVPQQPHWNPLGPPVSPDTAQPHTGHLSSQETEPRWHSGIPKDPPLFPAGKLRRGENLEENWSQSRPALPQVPWNNCMEQVAMAASPQWSEDGAPWITKMEQARSCWDPTLHGPKGFPCPKTSPEARAPAPPWLHVHNKEKSSFGTDP